MSRPFKYILDGHTPVPVEDVLEWARWYEDAVAKGKLHVAHDTVFDVRVSTVFLGLAQPWELEGRPILFETMVFGGPLDHEMDRYSTWDEALLGHASMVARVLLASEALNK